MLRGCNFYCAIAVTAAMIVLAMAVPVYLILHGVQEGNGKYPRNDLMCLEQWDRNCLLARRLDQTQILVYHEMLANAENNVAEQLKRFDELIKAGGKKEEIEKQAEVIRQARMGAMSIRGKLAKAIDDAIDDARKNAPNESD